MENIAKKYCIKIPSSTTVIYCEEKKIITLIGPLKQKSMKLKVKILVMKTERILKVSSVPFSEISNNERKKIKAVQGTTLALIKQLLIETSAVLYQKLQFVGVGYRAFQVDDFENKLLLFKLGYSHPLYFKISKELRIFCLKLTKLFIFGNSYQTVNQTSALIRSYKRPEPYKGKGILYVNEKIKLKEGKKV
jgi:large subunit ribosomal protein L6